jgi:hypothetical protein
LTDWAGQRAPRRARAAALVALAVGGCGGGGPVAARPPCTGRVALSASREARPRFTWAPDCAVGRLVVAPAPSQGLSRVHWAIRGGPDGIASGVRFGVVPPGATEEVAASFAAGAVVVYDAAGNALGSTGIEPLP